MIQKANFKKINNDSPRPEVVRAMYDLNKIGASGYLHIFNKFIYCEKDRRGFYQPVEFEQFDNEMRLYDLRGIIQNVQLAIKYLEAEISHADYISQYGLLSKTKKEIKDADAKEALERLKQENFYSIYPKFKKLGMDCDVKRQEVNVHLFKHSDHSTHYYSFIKFQLAMKSYSLKELLEKLHSVMA